MMKAKILSLTALFIFGATTVFASVKNEKIKVNGNCGMCKSRIEKAVNSMEGIESATWNKEAQELAVNYDERKTSTMQIQTSIAMAGHDTEMFSAGNKKYAGLPGCCQYDRNEKRKVINHGNAVKNCGHESEPETGCGEQTPSASGSCCNK